MEIVQNILISYVIICFSTSVFCTIQEDHSPLTNFPIGSTSPSPESEYKSYTGSGKSSEDGKIVFLTVTGGKPIQLNCKDHSKNATTGIEWSKNGKRIYIHDTSYLNVKVSTGDDEGFYKCVATGKDLREFNVTISKPYFWQKLPGHVTTSVGSSIELDCDVKVDSESRNSSQSVSEVRWHHDKTLLKDFGKECVNIPSCVRIVSGKISLSNIQAADTGMYTCSFDNLADNFTVSLQTKLSVRVPLRFLNPWPVHITRISGSNLQLSCAVNFVSGYTTVWSKDGKVISKNDDPQNTNERLLLRNVSRQDGGRYSCTVHYHQNFLQQYTIVHVKAVPGPLIVKAKQISETSVNVMWNDPFNTDSPILRYELYYYNTKGNGIHETQSSINRAPFHLNSNYNNITLTDLVPDKWYEVVMWAENEEGRGVVTKVPFHVNVNSSFSSSNNWQEDKFRNSVLSKNIHPDVITGDHFLLKMLHLVHRNSSKVHNKIKTKVTTVPDQPRQKTEGYNLVNWSIRDKVILSLLCIATLAVSIAATVGVLAFCTRKPQWQWITRVSHIRNVSNYCVPHDLDHSLQPVLNGIAIEDANENLLNDSNDADQQAIKMMSVSLSFANPAFDDDDEFVTVEEIPSNHGDNDGVGKKIMEPFNGGLNHDTRSVDTTASDPQTGSDRPYHHLHNSNIRRHLSKLSV